MEKRIEQIDILRGFAAIMMILGHSFIEYPINIQNVSWCAAVGTYIYTFHMELFFVLAGFCYSCKNKKQFYVGKVKRILIPYFIFAFIVHIFKAVSGSLVNGNTSLLDIKYIFISGGSYWFLYVIFIIFLVFPLIEFLFRQNVYLYILLGVVCIIFASTVDLTGTAFCFSAFMYQFPYFIIGYIVRKFLFLPISKWKNQNSSKNNNIILLLIAILSLAFYSLLLYTCDYKSNMVKYPLAIFMIIFLTILANWIMPVFKKLKPIKTIFDLSSIYSLQLYIFNGFLLTIIRYFICNILNIQTPLIIVLSIWILNIFITLFACYFIISKVKVFSFICGVKYNRKQKLSKHKMGIT